MLEDGARAAAIIASSASALSRPTRPEIWPTMRPSAASWPNTRPATAMLMTRIGASEKTV